MPWRKEGKSILQKPFLNNQLAFFRHKQDRNRLFLVQELTKPIRIQRSGETTPDHVLVLNERLHKPSLHKGR